MKAASAQTSVPAPASGGWRSRPAAVLAPGAQRGVPRHAPRAAASSTDSSTTITLDPASLRPVQCLKEWAVTCAALGAGQQTILMRKGGIRELTFVPQAGSFLLFPTAFHADAQLLKPGMAQQFQEEMAMQPREMQQLPLRHFARVTGCWSTQDPRVLSALDALHVCAEGFLDARLKWRAQQPLTLLELRCYTLARPLLLPVAEREAYFGCFSWVALQDDDVGGGAWEMRPALSDAQFAERQRVLRTGLELLDARPLLFPGSGGP